MRPEVAPDYGVDRSIELVVESSPTNYRALVQVKARGEVPPNDDGSYSLSVETSNFNYLLNAPNSAYVLYVQKERKLLLAWCYEELQRIRQKAATWQEQETVTIRFSLAIEPTNLDSIADKILSVGQRVAQAKEAARTNAPASLFADVKEIALADLTNDEVREVVARHGVSLVASGKAHLVVEQSRRFAIDPLGDAPLHLVMGYAFFSQGRFLMARDHLARAIEVGELGDDQISFASYVQAQTEHSLGMIDGNALRAREQEYFESASDSEKLLNRLKTCHRELISTAPSSARIALRDRFNELHGQITLLGDNHATIKAFADALAVGVHGTELHWEAGRLIEQLAVAKFARPPIEPARLKGSAESFQNSLNDWLGRAHAAQERAQTIGNEVLFAEALLQLGLPLLFLPLLLNTIDSYLGIDTSSMRRELSARNVDALRTGANVFRSIASAENEVRCRVLLAKALVVAGDEEQAKLEAKECVRVARANAYRQFEREARLLVEGTADVHVMKATLADQDPQKHQPDMATTDDQGLADMAQRLMASYGLPADRFENVLEEYKALRAVARLQVSHCKHLNLQQELLHTVSVQTLHAIRPNRLAVCAARGLQSTIPSKDADAVVSAFVSSVCTDCPQKEALSRSK